MSTFLTFNLSSSAMTLWENVLVNILSDISEFQAQHRSDVVNSYTATRDGQWVGLPTSLSMSTGGQLWWAKCLSGNPPNFVFLLCGCSSVVAMWKINSLSPYRYWLLHDYWVVSSATGYRHPRCLSCIFRRWSQQDYALCNLGNLTVSCL